jgi:hypothetical protein
MVEVGLGADVDNTKSGLERLPVLSSYVSAKIFWRRHSMLIRPGPLGLTIAHVTEHKQRWER